MSWEHLASAAYPRVCEFAFESVDLAVAHQPPAVVELRILDAIPKARFGADRDQGILRPIKGAAKAAEKRFHPGTCDQCVIKSPLESDAANLQVPSVEWANKSEKLSNLLDEAQALLGRPC